MQTLIPAPISLLLAVSLSATAVTGSPWEARYATFSSLSEDQIASGMTPHWPVHLPKEIGGEISVGPDEDGRAIGLLFLGTKLGLPRPLPAHLSISLEFQAISDHPARTVTVDALLLADEAWQNLPREVATREPQPVFPARLTLPLGGPATNMRGADAVEWTAWSSGNIAPRLRMLEGDPVLVLRIGGYHVSHREKVRVRNIAVTLSDETRLALREPLYPLKTARTLITDDRRVTAQRNIARFPRAAAVRDKILRQAEEWLQRSDQELVGLVPPASVPRAFNVGTNGCPIHGKAIYEHGRYPWILDTNRPYEVICPIGGETYPSNDFEAFLASGLRDESLLDGDRPDDGWGWVGPDGHRYWFVAYANHWHWRKIIPATALLAQAYTLTGEKAYAHKAALLLALIAKQYPHFDYATQSRYGLLQAAEGRVYPGKILNHIWETSTLDSFAHAYDAVWETIDGNADLQRFLGLSGPEIRALIEANILEEGIEAVFEGKIRGNFGMHQNALASAAIARQHGPVDEWLDRILYDTGVPLALEGIQYALYNLILRDGMPFESAPSYCLIWTNRLYGMAEQLIPRGIDLFAEPRFQFLSSVFFDLQVLGKFTPDVGDSGTLEGGRIMPNIAVYQMAARRYDDPRNRAWLAEAGALGDRSFTGYSSLFDEPLEAPADTVEAIARGSRLLDGYGMAILENDAHDTGLSLYYGFRGGHGHRDTLNIDLYAKGRKMLPDIGYPDFMNAYVPGIHSWTKNTVAHNLVMVDRRQQALRGPGKVTRFFSGHGIQGVEVDASDTAYPNIERYRRGNLLIDLPATGAYLIDLFQVRGGSEHHYSLHGPPGEVQRPGGSWSNPAEGTLAGPGVPLGQLYDHPQMGQPGYSGPFSSYIGSGFSHFFNARRLMDGEVAVRYTHHKDDSARLQIRILPEGGESFLAADAYASPTRQEEVLHYLLTQRSGENLSSHFIAVIEPFAREPIIRGATRTPIPGGVAIEIVGSDWRDLVLYRTDGTDVLRHGAAATDGDVAHFRFAAADESPARFSFAGGSFSLWDDQILRHRNTEGRVVSVAPPDRSAVVAFARPVKPRDLIGTYPAFQHEDRIVRHRVTAARALDNLQIKLHFADDLLIGRGRVEAARGRTLTTPTNIAVFPGIYPRSRLTNTAFDGFIPVESVSPNRIETSEPIPAGFFSADENGREDFWLVSFGPGADVVLEAHTGSDRPEPLDEPAQPIGR